MKSLRSSKLLIKIAVLFLFFIVIAFSISATVLILKTDHYINKSVERSFIHKHERIVEQLEKGQDIEFFKEAKIIKLNKGDYKNSIIDKDTLIYNETLGVDNLHRLRKQVIQVNGISYLLILKKNIEDFTNLKADVISTLIPVFIVLSIVIVVFSVFLSRYLFRPFNHILMQMKRFRVGENFSYESVKTTTSEFATLQLLYQGMVQRAEEDYQRLKEYTENMSHEFQTPLAIIRNKTENLIADEEVMENHAQSVKAVYDEVNHLSKLSNTLKLLTKIENNEFINKKTIYTKPVIEDHVEKLRELAGLKSVKMVANLDGDHAINIDAFLLEIVFKNLMRNAILYATSNSTIEITSTADTFKISNHSDTSEQKPSDLFRRFSKGKSNQSSLGLGLAIVKKICDLNGLLIEYKYINSRHCFVITSGNN
ncbi:HAMP domain-containing histidine kinase [Puteibacter caeruleilacunae]|nr:HAMP domain-containing histidine kinase [Puteibacter caeruleilacunae]